MNTTTMRGVFYAVFGVLLLACMAMAQDRPPEVRRITLDDAKGKAAGAAAISNVAKLQIDAARYHRQAMQADYFPKLSADFLNLHYNKFMGQTIQLVDRRTAQPIFARNVPLFGKDWTAVSLTVVQPVTQLLLVRQGVTVARADEQIARAKVAQLSAQTSENVERVYFALLIAQRRQIVAEKQVEVAEKTSLLLNTVAMPVRDGVQHDIAALEASKQAVTTDSEVSELMHTLNALIGFAPDTRLILAIPDPVTENVSLTEATQQAVTNSPEVVEAEQTLVKAKAASRLAKLEYVPGVAVTGGYINQPQAVLPSLPDDFSFIGFIATFDIFDFGKREKTVSERNAQMGLAEANVAAVKTKVAANVQKSFFELQRAQKIRDLTRRLTAGYQEAALENTSARAAAETEMIQAELDYRSAYSQLQRLINGR
jgi:outer membrane protein TolC